MAIVTIEFHGLIQHVRRIRKFRAVMQGVASPLHYLRLVAKKGDISYKGFDKDEIHGDAGKISLKIDGALVVKQIVKTLVVTDEFENYVPHLTKTSQCSTLDERIEEAEIDPPFVCYLSTPGGHLDVGNYYQYRGEFVPEVNWPGLHCIAAYVYLLLQIEEGKTHILIQDANDPNRYIKIKAGVTVRIINAPPQEDHAHSMQIRHYEAHYAVCSDGEGKLKGEPYESDLDCPLHRSRGKDIFVSSVECSNSQFP
jgi:hypothetical protein